jgi:hypothetical protein
MSVQVDPFLEQNSRAAQRQIEVTTIGIPIKVCQHFRSASSARDVIGGGKRNEGQDLDRWRETNDPTCFHIIDRGWYDGALRSWETT